MLLAISSERFLKELRKFYLSLTQAKPLASELLSVKSPTGLALASLEMPPMELGSSGWAWRIGASMMSQGCVSSEQPPAELKDVGPWERDSFIALSIDYIWSSGIRYSM